MFHLAAFLLYISLSFLPSSFTSVRIRTLFSFFLNDTPPTEIYTLPLHDALPISSRIAPSTSIVRAPSSARASAGDPKYARGPPACSKLVWPARIAPLSDRGLAGKERRKASRDRKSTRLNSSHSQISYAVFCLKKK